MELEKRVAAPRQAARQLESRLLRAAENNVPLAHLVHRKLDDLAIDDHRLVPRVARPLLHVAEQMTVHALESPHVRREPGRGHSPRARYIRFVFRLGECVFVPESVTIAMRFGAGIEERVKYVRRHALPAGLCVE